MIFLQQLLQPQGVSYWRNELLQSLQGIGYLTQASPTGQIEGTGTVVPTGPALQAASVVVEISSSGDVGSGDFIYSLDGGSTFSSPIAIPSGATSNSGSYYIAQIGVTLTFTNGTYFSPNQSNYFVAGETYSFETAVPTFPVTNWEPIAPSNNFILADATSLADMSLTQAQVTAGGYTQSFITPPPWGAPPDGYCDILSQSFYNRFRIQGTYTTGIAVLSNSGSSAQNIGTQTLLLQTGSGQQFTNLTGGTLPAASGGNPGTLSVIVQAVDTGGSYNNVPTYIPSALIPGGNYLTTIVSPTLPGVSVTNPLNSSPTCIHTGTGPASIGFTGTATAAFSVIFRIVTGGALGTSTYASSLDGGNTFINQGMTTGSGTTINGMQVSFSAGTYVEGDTYSFSTSWITGYGADTQTSLSLATADQNQWTQLAPSSPAGTYQNWAIAASPEVVASFVTQSATIPGQVNLLLIGQNNGPVSLAAIAAVTNYILPRLGINDSVLVQSVIPIIAAVTAGSGGTIQIHTAQQASVFAAVAAALFALQESIPPGGILFQSAVVAAIQNIPGVIDVVEPLWLNGSENNVQLLPNEVVTISPPPSGSYMLS